VRIVIEIDPEIDREIIRGHFNVTAHNGQVRHVREKLSLRRGLHQVVDSLLDHNFKISIERDVIIEYGTKKDALRIVTNREGRRRSCRG
jgi:hypothetical protein